MLVLTRYEEEIFRIGDDIIVKVLGLGGGKARIGIEAPKEIEVYREEIYQKIQKDRIERTVSDTSDNSSIDEQLKQAIALNFHTNTNYSTVN